MFKKDSLSSTHSKSEFIVKYFANLYVSYHNLNALWGFVVFTVIFSQCLSGTMLSFSLVNDCLLIPYSREEEDSENNYTDDFFWLHERGVDLVMISSFCHLLRKLYLGISDLEQEYSWKSGIFSFLIIQLTVFAGLVLCTTHLSEITLLIAANALHTFFLFKAKPYWWVFTDKYLNTDTIIRLMYLHYCIAFYLLFLGLIHGIDMHYDWKAKGFFSGIKQQLRWWDEVLSNELRVLIYILTVVGCIGEYLYAEPEALSYEIFMWGDIGIVTDVRFYGVAPHWYFRPYMAWLIACPYHYAGIFGLVFFFVVLYFQVSIFGNSELENLKHSNTVYAFYYEVVNYLKTSKMFNFNGKYTAKNFNSYLKTYNNWNSINYDLSFQWLISFSIFFLAILYSLSFLPYGRFYNKLGGNFALLFSYFYIFGFLLFVFIRNSWILNSYKYNIINH
jgi:quinol-cytochrome oxidoreductase complex cytochrome b subunit